MTIKIEKNIPITPKKNRFTSYPVYPWKDMEVGDSFLAPSERTNTVTRAAFDAKRRFGFEFTCRSLRNGVRVWRIK